VSTHAAPDDPAGPALQLDSPPTRLYTPLSIPPDAWYTVDDVTHALTALALSHTGLNRKTRFATLGLVVGSVLPDVDWASGLAGSAGALKYHRGFTHSILGVTVLAALLAAVIFYFGRRAGPKKSAPPLNAGWLLAVCWIGTASHLLLDFTNSYGVRPFLPFSGRWYAWDIMSIVDPLLLSLLVAGLGLSWVFRLVSEEVGARKPGYRRGAIFSLCCLVLLWGVRDLSHRRALGMLDAHSYRGENPERLGAFPSPANPFAWTGVAETASAFHVLPVDALDDDVDVEHTEIFRKPDPSPALEAAERSPVGAVFLDFARFPWASVLGKVEGFDVTFQDLRFISLRSRRQGFVADIELDKDLRVESEGFSYTGQRSGGEGQRTSRPNTSGWDSSPRRLASRR
jgi:inner membrane protein